MLGAYVGQVTYNSAQGINEVQVIFSECTGGYVGQGIYCTSRKSYFYLWKWEYKSSVMDMVVGRCGTMVHQRMVSTVKRVEFVSDRMSYM
jgi:glycopeptide antibiotics resistance protein